MENLPKWLEYTSYGWGQKAFSMRRRRWNYPSLRCAKCHSQISIAETRVSCPWYCWHWDQIILCLCQCYLKIPNLQPRIYGKEWNRDIWKGNYSITINTEETGKIWHMRDKYQYWSSWQNFYWELAAWVLWSAYLAHIPHFLLSQLSFIVPMNSSVESES